MRYVTGATAPKASTSKAPSAVPQVAGVVETTSMPTGVEGATVPGAVAVQPLASVTVTE